MENKMSDITVSPACIRCGTCVKVCPMRGFSLNADDGKARQDHPDVCISCGHCVANCPVNAVMIDGLHPECDVATEKPCTYNTLRSLMRCRRSVRLFQDKSVPKAEFDELLSTTRFAPTARNSQGVYWTIVLDPQKVQLLSKLAIDWFRQKQVMPLVEQWDNGYDIINRHAPHLVVTHSNGSAHKPVEDATIALTSFELLANAKGLGTCWAGFFMTAAHDYAPLHAALELPRGHKVSGALMAGYAAVSPQRIPGRNSAKTHFI